MSWDTFTPIASTLGGVLIGLSAVWMLAAHGRITGISGIYGGLLGAPRWDRSWRLSFVAGLLLPGLVAALFAPEALAPGIERGALTVLVAGLLVGFGTRLGSGCTSGHGICGVGRLSRRSLVATATFMLSGALTVWLFQQWVGG